MYVTFRNAKLLRAALSCILDSQLSLGPSLVGFDFSKTGEARKGHIFVALASSLFVWFLLYRLFLYECLAA
jgi:hypothetical protein